MDTTIKTTGLGFCWDDLSIGDRFKTVGRTITEADITFFVGCTGMTEVLFTNTEYLNEHTNFKGRVAPGALIYAFAEGLLVQSTMQGTGMAFLNMELDMKRPTLAGDTIHVELEVIEARAASTGNRGLVRTFNKVINQRNDVVLTYNPLRMLKGRDKT